MSDPAPGGQANNLPKRFYRAVSLLEEADGFVLALDGRPARTPGRRPLALPTRPLGDAVAAEWDAQSGVIDPRAMPLTRLANSAIDGVADNLAAVQQDLAKYAGSDLVLYRAGDPQRLVDDQAAQWDPVLAWAREALGARFMLGEGVMHVAQPDVSLERVRTAIAAERSHFRVAALHTITTLTGSVLIALMHRAGAIDGAAAWHAAHVDELYQESRWGADGEALARRAARRVEFDAASAMLTL